MGISIYLYMKMNFNFFKSWFWSFVLHTFEKCAWIVFFLQQLGLLFPTPFSRGM